MQIKYLIIRCFLFTLAGVAATDPDLSNDLIFIDCGSTAASPALSGREWVGDSSPIFSSSVEIKGSSTRSIVDGEQPVTVDPVPYKTARISRSQFSYTFHLNPGQKFIRLHFNVAPYSGFQRFNDLFTVVAGPFILLANFSASIAVRALSVDTIAKEFVVIVHGNQPLNLVFTPATSQSQGGSSVQPLPWDIRLKILIGAARGLAFLHASDRKVIYRDFNASNILLDGSYHAKISDFGLAKMGPTSSNSHATTWVMGTYGYAAPEYVATGHLHVKSDVYGFGVVLVEMLTGLRVLDCNRPSGQNNLVVWIRPHLSKRRELKRFIDSRLDGCPTDYAQQMARLSLTCLESMPSDRPSMQEVVESLERIRSTVAKSRQRRVHF